MFIYLFGNKILKSDVAFLMITNSFDNGTNVNILCGYFNMPEKNFSTKYG
jgi:hypothetical protein